MKSGMNAIRAQHTIGNQGPLFPTILTNPEMMRPVKSPTLKIKKPTTAVKYLLVMADPFSALTERIPLRMDGCMVSVTAKVTMTENAVG